MLLNEDKANILIKKTPYYVDELNVIIGRHLFYFDFKSLGADVKISEPTIAVRMIAGII